MPNSYNWFKRKCVAARGENEESDLWSLRVKWYTFISYFPQGNFHMIEKPLQLSNFKAQVPQNFVA